MKFKLVEELENKFYTKEEIDKIITDIFYDNEFTVMAYSYVAPIRGPRYSEYHPADEEDPSRVRLDDIEIEDIEITDDIVDDEKFQIIEVTAYLIVIGATEYKRVVFEFDNSLLDNRKEFEKYMISRIKDATREFIFSIE